MYRARALLAIVVLLVAAVGASGAGAQPTGTTSCVAVFVHAGGPPGHVRAAFQGPSPFTLGETVSADAQNRGSNVAECLSQL